MLVVVISNSYKLTSLKGIAVSVNETDMMSATASEASPDPALASTNRIVDNTSSVISWDDAMLMLKAGVKVSSEREDFELKIPIEIECEAYKVQAMINPAGDDKLY